MRTPMIALTAAALLGLAGVGGTAMAQTGANPPSSTATPPGTQPVPAPAQSGEPRLNQRNGSPSTSTTTGAAGANPPIGPSAVPPPASTGTTGSSVPPTR